MLLAQKVYAEGSLALCLLASSLFEDQSTAPEADARQRAALLLDLLTPVVKSWPSKYGTKANELAMQVNPSITAIATLLIAGSVALMALAAMLVRRSRTATGHAAP